MRLKTQIVYDEKDILKLHHMSLKECVDILRDIAFGILPTGFIVLDDTEETNGTEYSQDQYDATKYHAAMAMAIELLSQEAARKEEKKIEALDKCL